MSDGRQGQASTESGLSSQSPVSSTWRYRSSPKQKFVSVTPERENGGRQCGGPGTEPGVWSRCVPPHPRPLS
jgi:hypothetical protein